MEVATGTRQVLDVVVLAIAYSCSGDLCGGDK